MSDIDKVNEMLKANDLPELEVVEGLATGRFLVLSPTLAKEIADEMDERLRRQMSRRESEDILAEQVARASHLTLHEARALMIEFFDVGGSVSLFQQIKKISESQGVPLIDGLRDVITLKRIPQ